MSFIDLKTLKSTILLYLACAYCEFDVDLESLPTICQMIVSGVPLIVNSTKSVPGGAVVVAWEPPFEGACPVVSYTVYYREVVLSVARNNSWYSITVHRNKTSCTLHLNCRKEFDVAVTSLSGSGESAFNDSKIWNFQTGGGKVSPE